jgi:hypothetical protein
MRPLTSVGGHNWFNDFYCMMKTVLWTVLKIAIDVSTMMITYITLMILVVVEISSDIFEHISGYKRKMIYGFKSQLLKTRYVKRYYRDGYDFHYKSIKSKKKKKKSGDEIKDVPPKVNKESLIYMLYRWWSMIMVPTDYIYSYV